MEKIIVLITCFAIFSSPAFAQALELKSREEFRRDSHQICHQKWSTRGELDRRMYNHCMEQQMNGYQELVHLHGYSDQGWYAYTAYPYCSERWTKRGVSDARMIAHCLNQEREGIKDVMYYREKYGEDAVNPIVARALRSFNSWNMAAYKVKQYFE